MNPAKDALLAIVGAGTIGLALIVVLRELGFESVFVVDKIEEKLALARTLGAKAIHADQDNPARIIANETGGRRATGVFEAVGAAATVRMAYDLCDFGGTVVLIGNLAKEFSLPLQGVTSNETTIRGSYGFSRKEFEQAVNLASKSETVLRSFISGSCSLEETSSVMERMARGELNALKMLIARTGADSVDWVGTSMGGLIGMLLAAELNTPIRRLVMNDAGPFIPLVAHQQKEGAF